MLVAAELQVSELGLRLFTTSRVLPTTLAQIFHEVSGGAEAHDRV